MPLVGAVEDLLHLVSALSGVGGQDDKPSASDLHDVSPLKLGRSHELTDPRFAKKIEEELAGSQEPGRSTRGDSVHEPLNARDVAFSKRVAVLVTISCLGMFVGLLVDAGFAEVSARSERHRCGAGTSATLGASITIISR